METRFMVSLGCVWYADRTGQDKMGQNGTGQDRTGVQRLVRHYMTGQNRTEPVKMTNLPLVQKLQHLTIWHSNLVIK